MYESYELPYFKLIQDVPGEFKKFLDKENPVAFIIANCSNNEDSYQTSHELHNKQEFIECLRNDLKPKINVNTKINGKKEPIDMFFPGNRILSREGIKKQLILSNVNIFKKFFLIEFLKEYAKIVQSNRSLFNKHIEKDKKLSSWEILKKVIQEDSTIRDELARAMVVRFEEKFNDLIIDIIPKKTEKNQKEFEKHQKKSAESVHKQILDYLQEDNHD